MASKDQDIVEVVEGFPRQAGGAPAPTVIGTDGCDALCYYVDFDESGTLDQPISISNDSTGQIAVVTFKYCFLYKFGYPNDEGLPEHSLYESGVQYYQLHRIRNSSWIAELASKSTLTWSEDCHYIFTFHDSTFECIGRGIKFEVRPGTMRQVVSSLIAELL
jgi:hypothetical protein